MKTLKIRMLDDLTLARLQRRALRDRRPLEDEARELLRSAVATDPTPPRNLFEAIRIHWALLDGIDVCVPAQALARDPGVPLRMLLDASVIAELMKPQPAGALKSWAAAQPARGLATTHVARTEILRALTLLPPIQQQQAIAAAEAMFDEAFAGLVLGLGADAIPIRAYLLAERRRAGRPISPSDAEVAAIARFTGMAIVTGRAPEFAGCGVRLIDPWRSGPPEVTCNRAPTVGDFTHPGKLPYNAD